MAANAMERITFFIIVDFIISDILKEKTLQNIGPLTFYFTTQLNKSG
jgi:hypothetical protein